ncbi:MAG: hypothetical protein EPN85_02755 [Bacteroidetes bacterium]|nr:MAG: hypothetical protein EPN85_02755 [Bacteroidota bacterium]
MTGQITYKFSEIINKIRQKNRESRKLELERGGVVGGQPHSRGGTPFVLRDNGRRVVIEEEKNEVNIPREIVESNKEYEFRDKKNYEVLNEILNLHGLSLNDEVTEVKAGDIIISVKSAWDNAKRNYKGTLKQILSELNASRGGNRFERGAIISTPKKSLEQEKLSDFYKK